MMLWVEVHGKEGFGQPTLSGLDTGVFGKVFKNCFTFQTLKNTFEINGFLDVAPTTNALFKTNHKILFKK